MNGQSNSGQQSFLGEPGACQEHKQPSQSYLSHGLRPAAQCSLSGTKESQDTKSVSLSPDSGTIGRTQQVAISPRGKEPGTKLTTAILRKMIDDQGYKCALTGWVLEPKDASCDHIEPLSKGGPHVAENAQIIHSEVNRAKGTMNNEEFISMCMAVVRWHEKTITEEMKHYQKQKT